MGRGRHSPSNTGANVANVESPDRAIARIAEAQHGVISRRQLVALGFSRGAIDRRLAKRHLHPHCPGVYAVGQARITRHGRWMAGVLACRPNALLSHRSAGALWDLMPAAGAGVHVTVSRTRRHSRDGIVVHRARLHADDATERENIPVTTVARTLFDLAETLQPRQLERVFDKAEQLQVFDLRAIELVRDRCHGRHGLASLDALLSEYRGPLPTRSELERHFLELCRKANLPTPFINFLISGLEVDFAWLDRRVVVELDGYEYHRTRQAFERDRVRDSALQIAGYRVFRVTYRRLMREPEQIIVELRSLLGS